MADSKDASQAPEPAATEQALTALQQAADGFSRIYNDLKFTGTILFIGTIMIAYPAIAESIARQSVSTEATLYFTLLGTAVIAVSACTYIVRCVLHYRLQKESMELQNSLLKIKIEALRSTGEKITTSIENVNPTSPQAFSIPDR